MKIKTEKGYFLVVSPAIVYLFGRLAGVSKTARGAAFFPFIFVKEESFAEPWLINHECIHFRQQLEMFFVGIWVLWVYERVYARLILRLPRFESYIYGAWEQEAYLNQNNAQYLDQRKPYALFYYIHNKRKFMPQATGEIEMLD